MRCGDVDGIINKGVLFSEVSGGLRIFLEEAFVVAVFGNTGLRRI